MKPLKIALMLGATTIIGLSTIQPVWASEDDAHAHHKHEMHEQHNEDVVMGKGVVHTIDLENNKINLSHAPIPELKWPEMTMDLDVAEGVDLSTLKPEQNIHFHIELGEDKVYRITKIMMPKEGHQCEAGKDCPMHGSQGHESHEHDHNHKH